MKKQYLALVGILAIILIGSCAGCQKVVNEEGETVRRIDTQQVAANMHTLADPVRIYIVETIQDLAKTDPAKARELSVVAAAGLEKLQELKLDLDRASLGEEVTVLAAGIIDTLFSLRDALALFGIKIRGVEGYEAVIRVLEVSAKSFKLYASPSGQPSQYQRFDYQAWGRDLYESINMPAGKGMDMYSCVQSKDPSRAFQIEYTFQLCTAFSDEPIDSALCDLRRAQAYQETAKELGCL